MSDKLTFPKKDEFEEWLKRRWRHNVGARGNAHTCPLARFLRSYYKDERLERVDVRPGNTTFVLWNGTIRTMRTPRWASKFVRLVDDSEGVISGMFCSLLVSRVK
jgi:hypothetical protein